MRKITLLFVIPVLSLLLAAQNGWGQMTIYSQSFETDLDGYSHTPSQLPSADPGDQYFHRAEPGDGNIYESGGPYTNVTGSWLFVGSNPNSINSNNPGSLSFSSIDVTGYTDLFFSADFGAVPNDWDNADDLRVEYNFDGGTWQTLFYFEAPATNDILELQGNASGGINTANSTQLSYALTTITSDNFSGSGNTLNIRILCNANANYEAFGVDNVLVKGTPLSGPPVITNITTTPAGNITSSETVSIAADIIDADGIFGAELHWGTSSGSLSNTIAMSNSGGDTYTTDTDIPAQSGGQTVYYEIYAIDNNLDETTTPEQNYTVCTVAGVSGANATAGNTEVTLSWTNPGCFDKVIVIGREGSAVHNDLTSTNMNGLLGDADLTGANADWSARSDANDMHDLSLTLFGEDNKDYLLYKGTGENITITGLINGNTYHFRILAFTSTEWSVETDLNAIPTPTIAEPNVGDLIITEVNSHQTANASYMEIYNNTSSLITLDNVDVEYYNNGAGTASTTIQLSGSLAAGSYLIIARGTEFNTEYAPLTADYTHGSFYFNGDDDGMAIRTDNNGIIDRFNNVPSPGNNWNDNYLYYRVKFDEDGSDIANHWYEAGSNMAGTPKAGNVSTWNTAGSADWHTSANWDNEPNPAFDVVIPGGGTQPVINASGAMCKNLFIDNAAMLTIKNGGELTVEGVLSNMADATGLMIEEGGSLIHSTPNVPATVLKYIEGGESKAYNWAMVGTPVGAFPVQDLFLGDYVYSYDPAAGTQQDAWQNLSYGNAINPMQGYLVYTAAPKTLNFAGNLNEGNMNYSSQSGYNLVSNPYSSPIDWNAVESANANLASDYCYWDNTTGQYIYYTGSMSVPAVTTGQPGLIPVAQAFFVQDNAKISSGVEMDNSMRVHPSEYVVPEKDKAITDRIRFLVANGEQSDELAIYFASEGNDMEKFFSLNEEPQLYVGAYDNALVIDQNTPLTTNESRSIALGLQTFANETLTISAFDFEAMNPAIALYLEDTETGQFTDLRSKASFSFAATEGTFDNRFVLHVTNTTTDTEGVTETATSIYSYAEKAYINTYSETVQSVEIYTLSGQLVYSDFSNFTGIRSFELPATGVYIIKVQTENGVFTERVVINN